MRSRPRTALWLLGARGLLKPFRSNIRRYSEAHVTFNGVPLTEVQSVTVSSSRAAGMSWPR